MLSRKFVRSGNRIESRNWSLRAVLSASALSLAAMYTTAEAKAQTCSTTPSCIQSAAGSNNATFLVSDSGSFGYAIYAATAGAGTAIGGQAEGNGAGVFGGSEGSGPGVSGSSETGNGIYSKTFSSGTSAASVSADTPNDSSLAYWGRGGIILTGTLTQKGGNGGSWSGTSDSRVKKDVQDFRAGLAELERIHPKSFRYNGLAGTVDDGKQYVGVIAQDLEQIFPEMVSSRKAKLHKDDSQETDIKVVDPSNFMYVLINSVQDQQKIIERQNAKIERQSARISALEQGGISRISSLVPGGLGGLALGLAPVGFVVFRRKSSALSRV
jgi:hypothetical protein